MDSTIKKICAGDVRSASRLIRDIEDKIPEAKAKIKKLYAHTGKSFIIGITGAPGAGKSTLTDALITELRKQNKTVGVLAVDPTSPFTGGAILGDRIRMQRHAEDPGVFVRSLATRGALGGLSQAAGNAIHVMEAMGKDIIIVETVGIGQQEIDIINHAHSVAVVLVPGMGDEIQTMKAGLMEIADIFVINKANRAGARQLQTELTSMLNLSPKTADGWKPPIVMVGDAFKPDIFVEDTATARAENRGASYLSAAKRQTHREDAPQSDGGNKRRARRLPSGAGSGISNRKRRTGTFRRKDKKQKSRSLFRGGRNCPKIF